MQYPVGKPGCWNASDANCSQHSDSPQCVCSPKGEYPSSGTFPHGCGCINNTAAEVADMLHYPAIRLLQIYPNSAPMPQIEAVNSGWRPAPQLTHQESANFSAVCWLFGRDLQRTLRPMRPIGLIETTLGGTSIQQWSSTDALAQCTKHSSDSVSVPTDEAAVSGLFNGMIAPLMRSTILGAIWYQGICSMLTSRLYVYTNITIVSLYDILLCTTCKRLHS
jgi:hypothetical protein